MRFARGACPECGDPPRYILESMLVHFEIELTDGEFQYAGHSEEFVETSEPVRDPEGRVTLGCTESHEWQTVLHDQPDNERRKGE